MDDENPDVHLNLGIALKLKGDHPAARIALTGDASSTPKAPPPPKPSGCSRR